MAGIIKSNLLVNSNVTKKISKNLSTYFTEDNIYWSHYRNISSLTLHFLFFIDKFNYL